MRSDTIMTLLALSTDQVSRETTVEIETDVEYYK